MQVGPGSRLRAHCVIARWLKNEGAGLEGNERDMAIYAARSAEAREAQQQRRRSRPVSERKAIGYRNSVYNISGLVFPPHKGFFKLAPHCPYSPCIIFFLLKMMIVLELLNLGDLTNHLTSIPHKSVYRIISISSLLLIICTQIANCSYHQNCIHT